MATTRDLLIKVKADTSEFDRQLENLRTTMFAFPTRVIREMLHEAWWQGFKAGLVVYTLVLLLLVFGISIGLWIA
jgi:hypothetical protein